MTTNRKNSKLMKNITNIFFIGVGFLDWYFEWNKNKNKTKQKKYKRGKTFEAEKLILNNHTLESKTISKSDDEER